MKEKQSCEPAIASLVKATDIRWEMARQRRALEGEHIVLGKLLRVWRRIEACEAAAYEDTVAAQLCVLQEACARLRRLQRGVARTSRLVEEHWEQLQQLEDPWDLA